MASNARLLAIVDLEGNVVAMQLSDQTTDRQDQEAPSSVSIQSLKGQRVISIDVPREVLELPGPDLHRFLSQVKVSWPADVQVPKIETVRKRKR